MTYAAHVFRGILTRRDVICYCPTGSVFDNADGKDTPGDQEAPDLHS
jgi:hypothetical protein